MTYAVSSALQTAVYQALSGAPALAGTPVYDAVPAGQVPGVWISLGNEDVRDRSDKTTRGAEHRFQVSVTSDADGFAGAKSVASIVSDTLVDAPLVLARGRVVSLRFLKARARRVRAGQTRQIDLTFRAIVEDD